MGYPVNDIMAEKWYMKIMMVFFTLVGIAGGAMSIAGPVVGLTLDPNDITAANVVQVSAMGMDAALYFDCDKVDTAFGQKMKDQMLSKMQTNSGGEDMNDINEPRTSTDDTFKRLCFDRKGSHLYIAVTSGTFTLVGMFVFIVCGFMKRFEPAFVYHVPLLLSFLMVYDFVETNSMVLGFIKKCTEPAGVPSDDDSERTKNLVLWAPTSEGSFARYGVTEFGKACNANIPEDTIVKKNKPCRQDLANTRLLCTHFYYCNTTADDDTDLCDDVDFKTNMLDIDSDQDREDKACNDLGEGLIVWILGACFNVVANGMMMSALFIRKEKAMFGCDSDCGDTMKVTPTVVAPRS